MKILQVITSLRIGGAEKIVSELAKMLSAYGHIVEVAVFDGIDTPLKDQLAQKGVKVYSLGRGVYNPIYIFKLMRLMGKYDIIHSHNSSPQYFVALANLICHKTIVTTEHNTTNRRRDWSFFKCLDRWMYRQYNDIVCISEQARINLLQFIGETATKIRVVPNGIDIASFEGALADKYLKAESDGKFVVVMVAGFRPQKDQDTLIKALSFLSKERFELWLVGDGERREVLVKLANQLKISVKFLGVRSNIAEILHAADVIVMSSHYEGLSLSSVEGMCVGKPFIASDVVGLHEIVDGAGLLFPHEDAQALAHLILSLESDRHLYDDVASRCAERARGYDVNEMVAHYNCVYQDVMMV